ncbi:ABC transporter permease subunit [Methylobacterium organophilum]|uniref:Glycine betaine uptake system permease protein YehW n=1 Tax=Methylobacterium organophilum TaxID=410 RepID=A0ABQ4T7Z3_METOR|nr:ABC transporter permease subunit [Methylobacterium organophilum]GJE27005.1 Glycine betaine uptake system permease protein YehW [Methylobacterium organophilum]
MNTPRSSPAAVPPLLAGLLLAAASHPASAAWIFGAQSRPLSLARLGELSASHLILAGMGLALVGLLGVGLGLLATRRFAASWRSAIDAAAALAQGLPPVVVVALALPVLGFGGPPTLLALVAYATMPTLRSTIGAIEAVPPAAKEAAEALGMRPLQILLQVEVPLAAPGLLAALRTALVLSVATAAIGALAGAATLGTPIVAGLQNQRLAPLFQGACASAALAFLCDAALLAVAAGLDRIRNG